MVKKIHLLKFHKNVDEIENIVFGDSDTEGDRTIFGDQQCRAIGRCLPQLQE